MEYKSMEQTKQEFEKRFLEGTYYNKQTQDELHRELLLSSLRIFDGAEVLDFGTGGGYLSMALARRSKDCKVTGVDIVSEALEKNRQQAKEENVTNIEFVTYDGSALPFKDNRFDAIMTRYVLHHVPNLQHMFHEFMRVLKPGGQLLVADPCPDAEDKDGFIDLYMKLIPDGHIKFYTKEEMIAMAVEAGLSYEADIETSIRFPRKKTKELMELLETTDKDVQKLYEIEVKEEDVYTTTKVPNLSFFKG